MDNQKVVEHVIGFVILVVGVFAWSFVSKGHGWDIWLVGLLLIVVAGRLGGIGS